MEQVITVDVTDRPTGVAEKIHAHRSALLHRAVSVFVFCPNGRLLLQQRAASKYHSAWLWSNTCCGHPRPQESTSEAAHRRLREEMGFDCALRPISSFIYRAELSNRLTEYEFDHVYVGVFNGLPRPSPSEVRAWRWISPGNLTDELVSDADRFTSWFMPAWTEIVVRGVEELRDNSGPPKDGSA